MSRGIRKEKFYDDSISQEARNEIEKTITESSPAQVEKNGPETKNGTIVNSLTVKLRVEPNFESRVLEILRRGDKVKILTRTDRFCKVSVGVDKIGYVSSEFVKEE